MKAKSGFVLRDVVGEKILMPVGENITKFNGAVLLNTVSAFVWEKMQEPVSREALLQAVLDKFERSGQTVRDICRDRHSGRRLNPLAEILFKGISAVFVSGKYPGPDQAERMDQVIPGLNI